jgi:hypothetical protein
MTRLDVGGLTQINISAMEPLPAQNALAHELYWPALASLGRSFQLSWPWG